MATARELLEQADLLMRRNRGRSTVDIPVLTDVVAETAAAPAPASAPAPKPAPTPEPPPTPAPIVAELPVLTEAIEEVVVEIPPLPDDALLGESSLWPGPDTIDPSQYSITGPAPDTVAVVPPVTLKAAGSAPTPAPGASIVPLPVAANAPPAIARPDDDDRWRTLAEQISMQVLQRIDLFTDTGLKDQLKQHLQPIVDRASTELVDAINQHVGQLLRAYVSEAIEREIEQWRHGGD